MRNGKQFSVNHHIATLLNYMNSNSFSFAPSGISREILLLSIVYNLKYFVSISELYLYLLLSSRSRRNKHW